MHRSRPSRVPPRPGFTLIEVLVVVAIIALLVAILIPSLKKARDQAKSAACVANLHDLGIAHLSYANSNNGFFVPTPYIGSTVRQSDPGGDDNLFALWHRKYARNTASFTCPATTHRLRTPERVEQYVESGMVWYRVYTAGQQRNDFEYLAQRISSGGFGTSYEYNLWAYQSGQNTVINWHPYWIKRGPYGNRFMKSTKTMRPIPTYAILMHDGDDDGDVQGASNRAINNYPEAWDNHGRTGMNILYVDGHVEPVRQSDLAPPGSGGRIWSRQDR